MKHFFYSILFFVMAAQSALAESERWVVYYSDKIPAEKFTPYDVVVLDSDTHPPLASLQYKNKILLGYVSLGEAEDYRHYFSKLKDKNLLLAPNQHWQGHTVIDVRNPAWAAFVVEELIPAILHAGFNGIMLDTMDSPLQLEIDDPKKYPGMKEASIRLIQAIRMHYPDIKIMLNRGFAMLPEVAPSIDMVMAESTYGDWLPKEKTAKLVDKAYHQSMVDMLHGAQKINPKLKIYSLDYWPQNDAKGVKAIYAKQRANGFIPYVSTPDLQAIYAEP